MARLWHRPGDGNARLPQFLAAQPLTAARGTTERRKTFENIDVSFGEPTQPGPPEAEP
jgi:hypothetical protein